MQNLRVLRQRIRSVSNTQKITRAMQMVAGAKLRRLQGELVHFRPYAERLKEILNRFLAAHPALEHPLLGSRVMAIPPPVGLILVTSDTGLCGAYNERVIAAAENFLKENPSAVLAAIGKKGNRFLARRGISRIKEILDWSGRYDPDKVSAVAEWLKGLYLEGKVSAWWIATTRFISALRFKPVVERFLPVDRPVAADLPAAKERMITEPDPQAVAEKLLDRFASAHFTRFLLEAFTSEHSARMISMKNATDNAAEMIDHLTLVRNKVRQAAITKELIEVVSGAEALR